MNRKKVKITACLLAAVLVTGLSGCKQKMGADAYVKGSLDAILKDEISDNYAAHTEGGKSAAQQTYDDFIEGLTRSSQLDVSDEAKERLNNSYKNLLKASKYTVTGAEKNSDGSFTVTVEMEPLQFSFKKVDEERMQYIQNWITENMDTLGAKRIVSEVKEKTIDFRSDKYQEFADSPVYASPKKVEVKVIKKGGNYEITPDSLNAALELVFQPEPDEDKAN